jgi:hypothetical protein
MNTGTNMVGILGLLLVLASFGCHTSNAQTRAQAEHWIEHRDPTGFAVQQPQGWAVESLKDGHVLIHNADRSVFALAQPFKSPDGGAPPSGSARWSST